MFNVTFSLSLVALALNAESAFGTNQHLICKTVDDVFGDGTLSQSPMRSQVLQGPSGKRGPTGVKGEHGIPGLNGEQGFPGSKGERGLQGSKSGRGFPGLVGEQGVTGSKGERGLPGSNGERGLPGILGIPGISGFDGDRGLPGSKGGRGLPGLVDPQDIVNAVDEKMREVTRQFQEKIETLEGTILEHTSTIQGLLMCSKEEVLIYKSKCYFLIQGTMNYPKARELCTAKGGKPADILDAEHQSLVADYVRKRKSSHVVIWLGMSYTTRTLRFSNGNDVTGDFAASIRWWSGFPIEQSPYQAMRIVMNPTTDGFANGLPTFTTNGVLCEI